MPHVTFIHGIANKPPADTLLDIWIDALARDGGLDLDSEGVTMSMVYWADVMYPEPKEADVDSESATAESVEAPEASWTEDLSSEERAWAEGLAGKLGIEAPAPGDDEDFVPEGEPSGPELEAVPLPWGLKRRLMRVMLRDVHHYLFAATSTPRPGETFAVQDEIRSRFVAAVSRGAEQEGPHVVVSHSMGTVIAYDCLNQVEGCPPVDGLLTIGSPLGLDEVQRPMKPAYTRRDGFPSARLRGAWHNVYDRLDPVAGFDPELAGDYRRGGAAVVGDVNEQNFGRWRHSIVKYLGGEKLRGRLRRLLGL